MNNWKVWLENLDIKPYSALGLFILLALPVTLMLVFRSQDNRSSAATPDKLEAEGGTLSSTGVSKQTDTGASGGSYVLFNKQSSTPTPTLIPSSGYGPRYSLYGTGASGNYPQLPAGANIVVVDSTVPTNGTDSHQQLTAFLKNRTKVPNGVDAAHPTIVVFDKTATNLIAGQKPNHGAGTLYTISNSIDVIGEYRHVYLWGYNSKIYNKGAFKTINLGAWSEWEIDNYGGAFIGFRVLGFEIQGSHSNAYTASAWETSKNSDAAHAIHAGGGFQDLKVMDIYAHHIYGDFFTQNMWGSGKDTGNSKINWLGVNGSQNYEVAYNHVWGTGRQGICFNWGDGFWMHHNLIEGVAMSSFNTEDDSESSDPHRNVIIEYNHFRHWQGNTTWLPPFPGYTFIRNDQNRTAPENITIRHNKFSGGTIARVSGYEYSPIWMASWTWGFKPVQNLVFEDNWMDYTDWPEGNINRSFYDSTQAGNFLIANGANNLTVRRNNFGNRGISIVGATGNVIVEDVKGIIVR